MAGPVDRPESVLPGRQSVLRTVAEGSAPASQGGERSARDRSLTSRHKTASTRMPPVRRELVAPGLITVVVLLTTALSDFAARLGWCLCAERRAVLSATMVPITTVALRSCEPGRLRPDCAWGLDSRQALRGDRLAAGFGG